MIVLDEHLQGLGLEDAIRKWWKGRVCVVNELRPFSIIKDEAIPTLLRSVADATLVTLDWNDEWERQISRTDTFCIVAIGLSALRIDDVPEYLRRALRRPDLATKAQRRGKLVRVTANEMVEIRRHGQVVFRGPL